MTIETNEIFNLNEAAEVLFDKIFNTDSGVIENVERIEEKEGDK